jgi:phage terminase large subunit
MADDLGFSGGEVEFPEKLAFLFEPKRYKVLHGGRGGAKSWGIARALLILAAQKKLRILCAREFQVSIKDSVHKLLADQIEAMGLSEMYEVQKATIICHLTGSEFIFSGLRHNVDSLKSKEAVDIVWVEEAHNVSGYSWERLIPTIRKDGSEIWISFNPELETDETYKRFVASPPENAAVVQMSWRDNPWFPDVLADEREDLKRRDPDAYLNIWEGHCRQALDGAVYARELRDAQEGGRITRVGYDMSKPVSVICDLGWADHTSLWFAQKVGLEYRVIRSHQDMQRPWPHYLAIMQSFGYVIDAIWLPHDARAKQLGTGKSIEEITRASGMPVRIVPNLKVEDGISALRSMFPNIWWDEKNCEEGLNALRRYRYEVDPVTKQFSPRPLHDDASHFADAARYMAIAFREGAKGIGTKLPKPAFRPTHSQGWMA